MIKTAKLIADLNAGLNRAIDAAQDPMGGRAALDDDVVFAFALALLVTRMRLELGAAHTLGTLRAWAETIEPEIEAEIEAKRAAAEALDDLRASQEKLAAIGAAIIAADDLARAPAEGRA